MFDNPFVVPDGVAALIDACNRADGDGSLADGDATSVSVGGGPSGRQHHERRSAGMKVEDGEPFSTFFSMRLRLVSAHMRQG